MASLLGHINFLNIITVGFITENTIDCTRLSEIYPGSRSLRINIQPSMNQAVLLVFCRKGKKDILEGPESQLTFNLTTLLCSLKWMWWARCLVGFRICAIVINGQARWSNPGEEVRRCGFGSFREHRQFDKNIFFGKREIFKKITGNEFPDIFFFFLLSHSIILFPPLKTM